MPGLIALLLLMAAGATGAQPVPEIVEKSLGGFELDQRRFEAFIEVARLTGAGESNETVSAVRLREAEGSTVWERRLAYQIEGDRFAETASVEVAPVKGREGEGLLITYRINSSEPNSSRSWQLVGLVEGQLTDFGKPVATEGVLAEQTPGQPVAASWDETLKGDVLTFKVWNGRFFIIVPMLARWNWKSFIPAYLPKGGRWKVECERRPVSNAVEVELFPAPSDEEGEPRRVKVGPASKIEILWAEGDLIWDDSDDEIWLGVSEDIFLKVRIDGREGYLAPGDDLDAIGLPETEWRP